MAGKCLKDWRAGIGSNNRSKNRIYLMGLTYPAFKGESLNKLYFRLLAAVLRNRPIGIAAAAVRLRAVLVAAVRGPGRSKQLFGRRILETASFRYYYWQIIIT